MNHYFNVYVDRLRSGKVETFEGTVSSEFLAVEEPDLHFEGMVDLHTEAYIAGNELVLQIEVKSVALIPCLICNELVKVPVELAGLYHAVPLTQIPTGVFNMAELVRENILLETPQFAECAGGSCPQRKDIEKFLKIKDE